VSIRFHRYRLLESIRRTGSILAEPAELTRYNVSNEIARSNADGGPVAQWSELAAHNRLVGGSSPPGPTMK
jgi:hypothetical protein